MTDWIGGTFEKLARGHTPKRVVPMTEVDGLRVSTVEVDDMAPDLYETAIIDQEHTLPVERYATEEEAVKGHARWVEKVPKLSKVLRLGTPDGLIEEETVRLVRP